MGSLITDTNKSVNQIQKKILPSCDELLVQVGYFYFSGFEEIYEDLKNIKMKVIIGIDYDGKLGNAANPIGAVSAIKDNYFNYLSQDINSTSILDQKVHQDALNLFVTKIKNGSLEIRCNPEKNDHSKFFIFKFSDKKNLNGISPGAVLQGSSNFTKSGFLSNLQRNNNYLHLQPDDYEDHYKLFNEQWERGVPIVKKENFEEFDTKVLKKTWINKTPEPHLLFVKILDEYFQKRDDTKVLMPEELSAGKFFNVKFQEDAIVKGLNILEKHQGVIIADVVGLGKSIIASAIAKNLNKNTIVICAPHLIEGWESYLNAALIPGKVISRGKIKSTFKHERQGDENLIIIDEAHYYRNDLTSDYADLHMLCAKNKVILLTATPFNNKPEDVFNMIKLFQIPTKTSLQTIENLSEEFKDLMKEFNSIDRLDQALPSDLKKIKEKRDKIATQMRAMLSPIVIRRSRIDLEMIDRYKKDLKKQNIIFPKVNDPKLVEYDLGNLADLYDRTLDIIIPNSDKTEYVGARYKPTSYVKEKYLNDIAKRADVKPELLKKTYENIDDFIKRLLVRRFESCIDAFLKTLDTIINSNIKIKEFYEKHGIVPIYKKGALASPDDIKGEDDDEIQVDNFENFPEFQKLKEKGFWYINKDELNSSFYKDIKTDIDILKKIQADWINKIDNNFKDPKFERFQEILKKELARPDKRKVLIFSEFADTADYLNQKLMEKKYNVFKYTSKEGNKPKNREIVRNEFDANSEQQTKKFNILVATDAIAEGYNLNQAGTIINYDIPYNPTKVIQRVGRINRINKKVFDELFIYNFFPSGVGETEIGTRRISTKKMSFIKAIFGDDTKVLTKDEDLKTFFEDSYSKLLKEDAHPEVRFENMIYNIRELEPDVLKEAQELPRRIRINRKIKCKHGSGVLIYAKKGDESIFRYLDNNNKFKTLAPDLYLEIFEANKNEKANEVSKEFGKNYALAVQGLFKKNFMATLDLGKRQSLDKIEILMQKNRTKYQAYLKDLLYVVKELDSLPARFLKKIRTDIRQSNLDKDLDNFMEEVPPSYLSKIISRAQTIDKEEEKLIISEEITNV
jgi:superfamily II DNA or RNA helicase